MSRTNPKLEQYKKLLRPILEATGEVFCARLDAEVNARLENIQTSAVDGGVTLGLKKAIDLIRAEYRI